MRSGDFRWRRRRGKTENWFIGTRRKFDADGIFPSLLLVVFRQAPAELSGLYTNGIVPAGIKRFLSMKDFDPDRVFLDLIAASVKRLLHHVAKERALAFGVAKRLAAQNPSHFCEDLVGGWS